VALFFHSASLAVTASPDPVEVKQPNGKKFKAFIRGDEFQGWVETEQGHTVIKNPKTKAWEYAKEKGPGYLVPSGIEVDPEKSPPKGIAAPEAETGHGKRTTKNRQRTLQVTNTKPLTGSGGLKSFQRCGIRLLFIFGAPC
jgi:hypothetical protein